MKIGLQTWGTDGDVMPFLALAIGLRDAGHQVTLVYTSVDGKDYRQRSDTEGIELTAAHGNHIPNPSINPYAIAARPGSFAEYSKLLELYFEPYSEAMYAASEKLCVENELVIGHAVCITLQMAARKHQRKRISLVLTPLIVRSKSVSPIGVDLGSLLNSLMWEVGGRISTALWFKGAMTIAQREGLAPIKSLQKEVFTSDVLTLVAASGSLVPRPPDWAPSVQVCGFLNLPVPEDKPLPVELQKFLDAGEAPIYMTFGSCMQFDAERSTRLLMETAKLLGKRAIIQTPLSLSTSETTADVHFLVTAPHAQVFPQCSLIVHHGGAGTTQSSLLAGRPSVVVAHGFDQSYWGDQLKRLGIAGKVLYRRSVTAKKLAEAINLVSGSSQMKAQAEATGTRMRQEDGVKNTLKWILEHETMPYEENHIHTK